MKKWGIPHGNYFIRRWRGRKMIYITGDCHRNFERFNKRRFPEQVEMTKDDYVIICGDFGGVWEEELSSEEEMEEGWKNLQAYDYKVDYIVTHCCSSSTEALMSHGTYKTDILTEYLEEIRQKVEFKRWFFGHYHDNRNINEWEILLYEQIMRIL